MRKRLHLLIARVPQNAIAGQVLQLNLLYFEEFIRR
jgi:hypothetical protein